MHPSALGASSTPSTTVGPFQVDALRRTFEPTCGKPSAATMSHRVPLRSINAPMLGSGLFAVFHPESLKERGRLGAPTAGVA